MTTSQATTSRDLARIAVFVGLVAALGLIPAFSPFGAPVPITAQSLGVMLAGAILGPKRGGLAIAVFVLLVALGLPLLAGGRGGLGVFAGPTVGYLIGYPLAAVAVGALTTAAGAPYRLWWGFVAAVLGGVLLLGVIGTIGMMARGQMSFTAAATLASTFLPGDLLKAGLCAVIARGVHTAMPGLLPQRSVELPHARV